MKKIILTGAGGHFATAQGVVEELKKKNWEIYWVGAERPFETDVPFFAIKTGKLQRGRPLETFFSLLKLPVGFLQSLLVVLRIRPNVVLSFGSYASIPVSFTCWVVGIPVVVHEQTTTSGFANRLLSAVAKKVAISYPESRKDFPRDKVVLTGNPVRKGIFEAAKKRKGGKTVIYITGGSRGSQIINKVVFKALPQLLKLGKVYHQTGPLDFPTAEKLRRKYAGYIPGPNFLPEEVEKIYREATLVISRAGANTVSELEILGIPAILIPIPWAEKDEQRKNTQILVRQGTGLVLEQEELSEKALLKTVKEILQNLQRFKRKGEALLAREDAARKLVKLVDEVSR